MLPERIRIGVIGLEIGRWHVESYLAIPEVKVSAVCDIDERKLKTITIRYGIMKTYTDYEELCQSDDIDAVSICVPNYMHTSVAISALEHGKHILCEKPLSVSPEEGKKILEVTNRLPNLKAMVAMKFRFSRGAAYIKNMIENGELGEVYYGFTSYLKRSGDVPKKGSWRTKKELSGGGTLIDNGIHLLDLVWWLMGCPKPVEAFGNTYAKSIANGWVERPSSDTFGIESLATGIIKFENDASIMFDSAWGTLMDREIMEIRLFGTKGSATLWPFRIYYEDGGQIVSKTPNLTNISSENQFRHFIRCITDNKQPNPSIEQGLTILKMLDAVYRSAEKGRSVVIQ